MLKYLMDYPNFHTPVYTSLHRSLNKLGGGVEKGFEQQFIGKNALTYPMDLDLSGVYFPVGTKLAEGTITIGNHF